MEKKDYFSSFESIKKWLNKRRHYAYDYSARSNYAFSIFSKLIISIVAFAVFYSNIEKLNNISLWIIKLGSILILVSLFFIIKYGWKCLKESVNWSKRQRNWLRYLIIILIALILLQVYVNRTTILNPAFDYFENTDLKGIYSPVYLEGENSIFSKIDKAVEEDLEKYATNPKIVKLYSIGDFKVYGGVNDYLASLDRSMSYYSVPPTTKDFILRDLNNDVQKAYLNPLVDKINEKSGSDDEKARIIITMVQGIPYDWEGFETGNLQQRYPYEVLYDKTGVCGEKAGLMAFLLREQGYGVAIFDFEAESHRAVGIKCRNGNYNSNYCFVEPSDYYPIGQIPQNYVGGANIRNAIPEIIILSDGKTYA